MGGGFNQAQNFCQMGMQQQAQQPEDPTEATNPTEVPTKDREDPTPPNGGLPWWVLSLIIIVSAGAGVGTAVLLIRKKQKIK
jgi:hypothetical protein